MAFAGRMPLYFILLMSGPRPGYACCSHANVTELLWFITSVWHKIKNIIMYKLTIGLQVWCYLHNIYIYKHRALLTLIPCSIACVYEACTSTQCCRDWSKSLTKLINIHILWYTTSFSEGNLLLTAAKTDSANTRTNHITAFIPSHWGETWPERVETFWDTYTYNIIDLHNCLWGNNRYTTVHSL